MRGPRRPCFATCAPGLEPLLHTEAKALKLSRVERQVGGVYFEADRRDLWRCNLHMRTAIRVLLRLDRFDAPDDEALYRRAAEVEWEHWLKPEGSLVVDAQTRDSTVHHSRFIEQRVKDAVCDRFRERSGVRPDVERDDPDLYIHAHLFADRATLSVDSSGASLHKRGWRVHQGRAPLAETTAAAVVALSGWDGRSPLIDPFCGSGTLLIEAALQARGVLPGTFRSFAFERWPDHDARAWDALRTAEIRKASTDARLMLFGSDVDGEQIEGAEANARSAGLPDAVKWDIARAQDLAPKPGWNGWIVSNLPYGERVAGDADLPRLYADLGRALNERARGFHYALLTARGPLPEALGLRPRETVALKNGALDCVLLLGEIEG